MNKEVEHIIDAARAGIGSRFAHQARSPGVAVDCVGLLAVTADKLGVPHGDIKRYPRLATPDMLSEGLADCGLLGPFLADAMKTGDVLVFRWGPLGRLGHVGILVSPSRFIHAYAAAGRVCESDLSDSWLEKVSEVWRFPERRKGS